MRYDISHLNTVYPSFEKYALEAQAMRVLIVMLSTFDHATNDHAHRTAQLAEATARRLDRSEEELYVIRLAALLHDVGKIGVPAAIRDKPGPLTHDEWTIMRRHPGIGRQILEQIGGVFQKVATIVGAHHEHWDGLGYPLGLAEEEIPIGARILAVVDSYDAMISPRPYREPLSTTQARAELQCCSGSHYDPCTVDAFLYVLDEQEREAGFPTEKRYALSSKM